MERTPRAVWGEGGATLVELCVALAAASVLFVAVVVIWQQSLVAYFNSSETADLQQEARVGYERITKELRLAGVHPCTNSTTAVTQAASASVTIQYDSPSNTIDCTTLPTSQDVKYAFDSANLRVTRQLSPTATPAGSIDPLTGGTIGTLTFQYWKCDGTAIVFSGTPPAVRRCRPTHNRADHSDDQGERELQRPLPALPPDGRQRLPPW